MHTTALIGVLAATAIPNATTPAVQPAGTTPSTTPSVVVIDTASRPAGCTQERFRSLVRKIYAQKKISAADHEALYQARRCLKHQKRALAYQRKYSAKRRERLDPWGYRWSLVDPALKARLHRLKMCESTGNYRAVNGPYTGAYQYHRSTWARAGGSGEAMDAPPREQDTRTAWFFPSHAGEWACKA